MKRIFIICSVRGMGDEYKQKLEKYVEELESDGCIFHLPHRDTDQAACGLEICSQNREAIVLADEIHIFYSSKSQGTHFDMGVAFAYEKPLVVIENEEFGEGKSYPRMLTEWEEVIKAL
jgi:nucleoside 2-deoxyribosyltransferase